MNNFETKSIISGVLKVWSWQIFQKNLRPSLIKRNLILLDFFRQLNTFRFFVKVFHIMQWKQKIVLIINWAKEGFKNSPLFNKKTLSLTIFFSTFPYNIIATFVFPKKISKIDHFQRFMCAQLMVRKFYSLAKNFEEKSKNIILTKT